jgi:AhpD family alkylhydroperoxidase
MHYQEPADKKLIPVLLSLARPEGDAFIQFDQAIGREDGHIPRKYRELIALAVGFTTQCPYCIEVHTKKAKMLGATREEIAETALIAAALRAGAAVTHGTLALKIYGQAPQPA